MGEEGKILINKETYNFEFGNNDSHWCENKKNDQQFDFDNYPLGKLLENENGFVDYDFEEESAWETVITKFLKKTWF